MLCPLSPPGLWFGRSEPGFLNAALGLEVAVGSAVAGGGKVGSGKTWASIGTERGPPRPRRHPPGPGHCLGIPLNISAFSYGNPDVGLLSHFVLNVVQVL